MAITCVFPKLAEISSIDSQRLFDGCIQKFSGEEWTYSTHYEDYSELQIALLIRDRAKIRRLLEEVEADGEIKQNTIPTCILACIAVIENGDDEGFALLFERASVENKATVLTVLVAAGKIAFFEEFWQVACLSSQAYFFACGKGDSNLVDRLFERANPQLQRKTLFLLLALSDEKLFRHLWQKADPIVYQSDVDPWIISAINVKCVPIILFLLQSGVSVQVFNGLSTPLEQACTFRNEIGENIVTQISDLDQGFSHEITICKLFGHAFDLKGALFEGFDKDKFQWLIDSIIQFLEHQQMIYSSAGDPIFSTDILETLRFSSRSPLELIERAKEKWSLIRCGWSCHAIVCIFSKDYCIKINTGCANGGIRFYLIGDREEEKLGKAITTLIQLHEKNVSEDEGCKYFDETLDKNLNLNLLAYLRYEQKGGHCVWYSLKAALLTLLIIKKLEGKAITYESLAEVWEIANFSFSMFFEEECCEELAAQAIPLLQKHAELFDADAIFFNMIETCVDASQINPIIKLIEMIPSYAKWRHPKTGQSLPQLFLSKKPNLSISLLKLHECGCDFSIIDNRGKSFYDDFQAISIDLSLYEMMLEVWVPSISRQSIFKQLEHPMISRLFTQYRHPDSSKTLAQLALESQKFHLVGLLCFLGADFSAVATDDLSFSVFSDSRVVENLRSHAAKYPLSEEKSMALEHLIQRLTLTETQKR